MKKLIPLLSYLIILSLPAQAANEFILVQNAWTRETPPQATNVPVYMVLINRGTEADRLLGASGDIAKKIKLHTFLKENNVTKMRPVDTIVVNPGMPVVLRPTGLHIMLIGLRQPLQANQTFPLTLHFKKTGDVLVEVTVKEVL